MSSIRAVFLDLDNTLYAYEPCNTLAKSALYSFLSKRLSIEEEKVKTSFDDARIHAHRRLSTVAAGHSRLLYIQSCIESLCGKTDYTLTLEAEAYFWRIFLEHMELRPGALAFLTDIKKRGIQTAIVTDLTTQIQLQKICQLKLAGYVDWLVSSEESGSEKPAPASYQLAAKKTGIPFDNTMMIGESYDKDILAARALRMETIYLNLDERKDAKGMQAENFSAIYQLFLSICK